MIIIIMTMNKDNKDNINILYDNHNDKVDNDYDYDNNDNGMDKNNKVIMIIKIP